ncbi:MAG: hypothetical protein HY652_01235 [Acidobacteria bacterium]|nr:hypothetical protein [Acidobacteriota bacterium]
MDRMLVLAVIKDIEIIGEAANQVSKALPLEAWLRPVDPEKAAQACRRLGLRARVGQRRQPSPHRPEP